MAAMPETNESILTQSLCVLWVAAQGNRGEWLQQAVADHSGSAWDLLVTDSEAAALETLVHEPCQAIIVFHSEQLDAVEFCGALRGSGCELPVLILGRATPSEFDASAATAGADEYVCLEMCGIAGLEWAMQRAVMRHELQRQNRRLQQQEQQRLSWERNEAERLISEQRALLQEMLPAVDTSPAPTPDSLLRRWSKKAAQSVTLPSNAAATPSTELKTIYRDLLRTYVIMGTGNLTSELQEMAQQLVQQGINAQQTMLMHLEVVEQLVTGLGQRSARHLLTRADLLVLELMMALAEGYRTR
jgi:CheY-like chemotaxis protein